MSDNDLKTALQRARNICKDDPSARHALDHILKHGERYFLLIDEDQLPKVLRLAREVTLRHAEDRNAGVARMMPTEDGAVLARAVMALALVRQSEVMVEQLRLRDEKIGALEQLVDELEAAQADMKY
jgi:hypothetical protein